MDIVKLMKKQGYFEKDISVFKKSFLYHIRRHCIAYKETRNHFVYKKNLLIKIFKSSGLLRQAEILT